VCLAGVASAPAALTPGTLRLDANFHTIGVRAGFTTSEGGAGNDAVVEYRRPGEPAWRTAPEAWLDVRPTLAYASGAANWARNEARTRIFGLAPGVTYEVRVTFGGTVTGPAAVTGSVTTRALAPPDPTTRTLYVDGANGNDAFDGLAPGTPKRTLAAAFALAAAGDRVWIAPGRYVQPTRVTLAASGTPSAWIRVTRWPSLPGAVVLEGTGANDSVLVLAGSYVRVDGLTIRHALGSCLRIEGNTTDHWIDRNVITDWNADDDPGTQHEGGIAAWSNATRLVVLDNLLKRRDLLPGPQHGGGNGVWVKNQTSSGAGGGGHVVRGNTIIGGWDGVGSDVEADPVGGFFADTDVYENVVSDQQDDGIQMEGANVNCAIFANVVGRGRAGIAFAPNGIGPLFVMRNRILGPTWSPTGTLYKVGAASGGRTWLFHDSVFEADGGAASGASGIQQTNPGLANLVTRNNAWQVDRYVVETTSRLAGPELDMDFDAFFTTDPSGRFVKWFETLRSSLAAWRSGDGQEPNGLTRALATLEWTNAVDGGFTLRADSVLRDAGVALPGIDVDVEDPTWNAAGGGPDIGAIETRDGDLTPPLVAVTSPAEEDTVGGTVTVEAEASDDTAVARVALFVDGTLAASDAQPPYAFTWTTVGVADGAHRLSALATDVAGNAARASAVRVLVDNGRGGGRNAYLVSKAKLDGVRFAAREVTVTDAFGAAATIAVRPVSGGSAAVQGGGAIVDPSAALDCYKVKAAPGAPRYVVRQLDLTDAFGTQRWELRRAVELCLPATRDASPVDPARDAYACYQAKTVPGTPRFATRELAVTDAASTTPIVAQKPYALCVPARLDGGPLADPAARLACYRGKTAPGAPRPVPASVTATDAFGTLPLTALKPAAWCQPAAAPLSP
jgi:hypothetical protein